LVHGDLLCPTPGIIDSEGNLPFGRGLRAPEDWKKQSFSDGSTGGQGSFKNQTAKTRTSSNVAEKGEVTSPEKRSTLNKRKGVHQQVYRRVEKPLLTITDGSGAGMDIEAAPAAVSGEEEKDHLSGDEPKKKKPTPTSSGNSAAAATQPCLPQ
jgi:hypothetical protein